METQAPLDEVPIWLLNVDEEAVEDPATMLLAQHPPADSDPPPVPGRVWRVALPTEIPLHHGSFTVSSLSLAMVLLMVGVIVVSFAASGMLAGMGVGLALVALLL